MTALTLKNLPPKLLRSLRAAAEHDRRSLTQEVIHLLQLALHHRVERPARVERQGRRLDAADLFIGAIAVARNATVVTGNQRHYARIPGVTLENWMTS